MKDNTIEEKFSILGKLVTLIAQDSMEFSGLAEFESEDKIGLMTDMGYLIIYKKNLIGVLIIDDKSLLEPDEDEEEEYIN